MADWRVHTEGLRVGGGVVHLRGVSPWDARAWSAARLANRHHLERWEPTVHGDWEANNSIAYWPRLYGHLRREAKRGTMIPCVIVVDGGYAGQLTIGGIQRGSLQSAWIGYWVAERFTGGGVGTAAVALGLDHAFGAAGLHRVEATVRPENGASRAVLARNGFREEGLLRRYLDVDGAWRDHLLLAQTSEERVYGAASALVREGHATPA